MALTATTDGATAADRARDALAAARAGGGSTSKASAASPYRIPVRSGGSTHTENRRTVGGRAFEGGNAGLYSDDPSEIPEVGRFTLDDNGIQAAIGSWYAFDDDQRKSLMSKMWYLGLTDSSTDFDGAFKAWQAAVGHAARFAAAGREIDPRDVLDMLSDGQQGASAESKRQQTTVRRSIDITDPATAREWVQQAFQQSMGRKAEDAEVRALVESLQAQQRGNPTVETMTPTKWDEQGNAIESTTTQTGGVDPDAFFARQMADDPEAGAHQAAAQLYPALLQALGAGG